MNGNDKLFFEKLNSYSLEEWQDIKEMFNFEPIRNLDGQIVGFTRPNGINSIKIIVPKGTIHKKSTDRLPIKPVL